MCLSRPYVGSPLLETLSAARRPGGPTAARGATICPGEYGAAASAFSLG